MYFTQVSLKTLISVQHLDSGLILSQLIISELQHSIFLKIQEIHDSAN